MVATTTGKKGRGNRLHNQLSLGQKIDLGNHMRAHYVGSELTDMSYAQKATEDLGFQVSMWNVMYTRASLGMQAESTRLTAERRAKEAEENRKAAAASRALEQLDDLPTAEARALAVASWEHKAIQAVQLSKEALERSANALQMSGRSEDRLTLVEQRATRALASVSELSDTVQFLRDAVARLHAELGQPLPSQNTGTTK